MKHPVLTTGAENREPEGLMAEHYEAIVIGGGPAGLTAGIYLMRAGIKAVLVEKMVLGGTPMKYEFVENYPGFPGGIHSKELMARMVEQAKSFGLSIREFAEIEEVSPGATGFRLKTGSGELESSGIVVATGNDPVKLDIPGEKELVGMGVSNCATCDGMFFRDADVAVIGGGDAAIQEGLALANIARKVYVIHRRDRLRAQKIIQDRAFGRENMEFLWNKRPVEITGKGQVEGIILEDTVTKTRSELTVQGIFIYAGARPGTAFLGDLVERDGAGFIITNDELATRTAGLYAAGDCRKKTLRQISTAVGDGAVAAISLERHILEK
jgi:thioredoxin reductase (NADPH)